jgi:stearoyl-CoA desaturase (delta-9 desaturase)
MLHLSALQALFYATWSTLVFSWLLYIFGGLGITAGAHRLWAHKSYKATPLLRGQLLFLFD